MSTHQTDSISGMKVTVMGLGLNGGGLASARFFAQRGALVSVTDTRDETVLKPSIDALDGLPIRFVLGRHEIADFSNADLVIKNPAVRPDSEYLKAATRVETDLSVFLTFCTGPIVAITGSKGKSTTASATAHALNACGIKTHLGGNITRSPLDFIDEVEPTDRVVLELSSWQLGDLKGRGLLKPLAAVLTRIVPDHQDRYGSMEAYVADKRLIYADQQTENWTICDAEDEYGRSFASETRASVLWYGDRLPEDGFGVRILPDGSCIARLPGVDDLEILPAKVRLPGGHNRRNLAAAAAAAWCAGANPAELGQALAGFGGVEHRLEVFAEYGGVRWCNDSAATVPQSTAAALAAFDDPVILITGGTDKCLDFTPVREAYRRARTIILLAGTGTEKLRVLLDEDGIPYEGPYADFKEAVKKADSTAKPGSIVVLSPGCTSFGMFKNEFDRGNSFKREVQILHS
ncbi:MAG: UDP-N-acetylmuramoyl-L-alanine--D-glutamate ligase [Spirochaetia bacterium]|nr:UDP-N-acetylmuramoyl-L-alanine--D-glutamate ligase [Spirochaetia bacterium]